MSLFQEQSNRKKKEEDEKLKIREFLRKSGELNKLKEGLKMQLLQNGWYEDIRMYVKDCLAEEGEKTSIEEIYEKTSKLGKEKLDDEVKSITLAEIQKSMDKMKKK
eukprot:gene3834-6994_t